MVSKRFHREHSNVISLLAHLSDMLAISLSAWLAFTIPHWPAPLAPEIYQLSVILGLLLSLLVFPRFGIYASWRGRGWLQHVKAIVSGWCVVLAILVFLAFITKSGELYSRQWLLSWAVLGLVFLVGFRGSLGIALRLARLKGWNRKQVVVIGAGKLGQNISLRLRQAMATGLEVVAFLDDKSELHGQRIDGVIVAGGVDLLPELLEQHHISEVWVALPLSADRRINDVLHMLRHSTIDIRLVPDIFNFNLINHSVTSIAGLPVVNLSESPMHGVNWMVKNIEDKILASTILLLISPLMLALAMGVKLSSPGPVFYRQERVSWNGKSFAMLKFRSMPVDAENKTGAVWAKSGDNRATAFGSFIRKTSLDELPQFINVLRGDMSIVGPRPERPVFVEQFKNEIPDYMKKHMVKAGITGWAQINGWRGNTDLNKRIEFDLQYIENWTLWFDLKIIFLTIFKGFVHKNAY
ncbi:MAG: undecaprenyl-phosphate glucose phosphotransferase [Gammaproteobacteria bacterium]|nr:undecaprenyl-phosphate glucose phosphotransferase [Gammaproteobacteria bacterium]